MAYLRVKSIKEALTLLKETRLEARVIAGGTDLSLQGLPENIIDIGSIDILKGIAEKDGLIEVGAAVTHATAATSALIFDKAAALAEACSQLGSPQIRNIGTLGGNVINAAPAADAAVALVALEAKAELIDTAENLRQISVNQLYAGFNCSAVDCSLELLIKFLLEPCLAGEGSAFVRFAARKALSLPMVNAAARVKIENRLISDISLVVAPVKPAPTRLVRAESMLIGEPANKETWQKAELSAAEEVDVRSSLLRCSADYRKHLIGVAASRALQRAAFRALSGKDGL